MKIQFNYKPYMANRQGLFDHNISLNPLWSQYMNTSGAEKEIVFNIISDQMRAAMLYFRKEYWLQSVPFKQFAHECNILFRDIIKNYDPKQNNSFRMYILSQLEGFITNNMRAAKSALLNETEFYGNGYRLNPNRAKKRTMTKKGEPISFVGLDELMPSTGGKETSFIEMFACENPPEVDFEEQGGLDFYKITKMLTPKEQDIIHGLYVHRLTFKQIGMHYKLSRERIRQIHKDIIKKLKEHLTMSEIYGQYRYNGARR
ncbi:MAG: sigma-70 family RNA polymerase sigma factor [Alphaproteobacteria bacterium]|nr:sigma-70 family RNA polymerase sigma factor [Alphaproteobacteria bacterium]